MSVVKRHPISAAAMSRAGTDWTNILRPRRAVRSRKLEPASPGMLPYGDYDTMLKTLTDQLDKAPYLLGERFSAADVLWGTALRWTMMFGLVPDLPVLKAYAERVNNRPAALRARAKDAELAKAFE